MTNAATLVPRRSSRPPIHALYTNVAASAGEIATLVERRLGTVRAAETTFTVRVTRPHGPSTGAGALAMQHIVLDVADSREIVIGRVCTATSQAWVHGYEAAAALYEQRNRRALPMTFGEYAELAWKLDALLALGGLSRVAAPPAPAKKTSMWAMLFAVLASIAAFVFVWKST